MEEKIWQKIKELEEEIRKTPYHKGTEHHIGVLKAKIAKLKEELRERSFRKGGGKGFAVKKEGDATISLVGLPSVGKSSLLSALTNAPSKVADYPFTTVSVVPGAMFYRGALLQLFDLPGIIPGASQGKGRGKEVLSVVRVSDLILIVIEATNPETFSTVLSELREVGIRPGEDPPKVVIEKRTRGGIEIVGKVTLSKDTVIETLQELGYRNCRVTILEPGITIERLVDALLGNRVYLPYLLVLSKSDLLSAPERERLKKEYPESVLVSTKTGEGLDLLREKIWEKLGLVRVFLKKDPKEPPSPEPLIVKKGSTVLEAAQKLFGKEVKIEGAKIEGKSVKYPGQLVSVDHVLEDGDVVYFLKG